MITEETAETMQGKRDEAGLLRRVRAVLLDMDGVLYVGNQPLPGVQELLDYLDASGRRWLCVTNNSSRTSATFSEKLAKMQIRVDPSHILGSAQATAEWLSHQAPPGTKVLMMGEESLRSALVAKGFDLIADPFEAEIVVASIYFSLNYAILSDLALAIRNGARFIATNPDPSLPTERGQVPGTGSIVALLSKDFLKLVLIALLIASPVAWYAMNRVLYTFARSSV